MALGGSILLQTQPRYEIFKSDRSKKEEIGIKTGRDCTVAGDRSLVTIDAYFRAHISRSGKCTVFHRGCGGLSLLADRDLEKLQFPGDASEIRVYPLAARN